jgi:hypothetical protein
MLHMAFNTRKWRFEGQSAKYTLATFSSYVTQSLNLTTWGFCIRNIILKPDSWITYSIEILNNRLIVSIFFGVYQRATDPSLNSISVEWIPLPPSVSRLAFSPLSNSRGISSAEHAKSIHRLMVALQRMRTSATLSKISGKSPTDWTLTLKEILDMKKPCTSSRRNARSYHKNCWNFFGD